MTGEVRFISSICRQFLLIELISGGRDRTCVTRVTAELVLRRRTFGNPCFRRQEALVRPGYRPIHT